jgi:hypothetical protein
MSKRDKLIAALRNNPADCRLEDACKMATWIGFTERKAKGSHRFFSKPGERTVLNFQDRGDGRIPEYQAKQLLLMVNEYEDPQP